MALDVLAISPDLKVSVGRCLTSDSRPFCLLKSGSRPADTSPPGLSLPRRFSVVRRLEMEAESDGTVPHHPTTTHTNP